MTMWLIQQYQCSLCDATAVLSNDAHPMAPAAAVIRALPFGWSYLTGAVVANFTLCPAHTIVIRTAQRQELVAREGVTEEEEKPIPSSYILARGVDPSSSLADAIAKTKPGDTIVVVNKEKPHA